MPSLFNPFSGLSCLTASAVDVVDREQSMLFDAFAGRQISSCNNNDSTNHYEDIVSPLPTTKPNTNSYYDTNNSNNSTRSCGRSIYTTMTGASRRSSLRSTISRADSYKSTQSGFSVRSCNLWYMKRISPSIIFWNDESHTDTDLTHVEESGSGFRTANRSNTGTGIPILENDNDFEVTTEDYCYEDEEKEDTYFFCDSSGSDASEQVVMTKIVGDDEIKHNCESIEEEVVESFCVSSILGPHIVRRGVDPQNSNVIVYNNSYSPTDTTLQKSALVGLYFAKVNQCHQTTEYVNLFTSGYNHLCLDTVDVELKPNELQGLTIIFCNADDEDIDADGVDNGMVVPTNLPNSWYTLPRSENTGEIKRRIMKAFDIVTTSGPALVIFDPMSGRIVCSNAILDIVHLDRSNFDQYDTEACQLYDSWLQKLIPATVPDSDEITASSSSSSCSSNSNSIIRYEQFDVDGDEKDALTIEYMDGERSSYERSLPYSI